MEPLLTAHDLMKFFKCSRPTLYRWIEERIIKPPFYVGRGQRWYGPPSSVICNPSDDPAEIAEFQPRIDTAEHFQGVDF